MKQALIFHSVTISDGFVNIYTAGIIQHASISSHVIDCFIGTAFN